MKIVKKIAEKLRKVNSVKDTKLASKQSGRGTALSA